MRRALRQNVPALLLALGIVAVPGVGAAQVLGAVAGTVKDASGGVLPGVTVEASSPALIERVRSVATDGTGQYKIVDLRPGSYVVTFTLPGFITVKREGLELTGSQVVAVNADMRVGAVAEIVTVTGETPVVDVRSVRRQTMMTSEVLTCEPGDSVQSLMSTMTNRRIRHLPVVDGETVVGMISIRDLVRLSVDDEAPRGA